MQWLTEWLDLTYHFNIPLVCICDTLNIKLLSSIDLSQLKRIAPRIKVAQNLKLKMLNGWSCRSITEPEATDKIILS
ncbi:hypothetical protein Mapa_000513 [Marchantia paleacea]|nr:hypothetical protein Mapa_000513 [Marchantia paleacea]